MTHEAQRIAIAEACGKAIYEELGIRYKDGMESWGQSAEYTAQKCANYQRQGLGCELIKRKQTDQDFDPLNDLNVMHESEKVLTGEQAWEYVQLLAVDGQGWCATAAQRAEAFLKTLKLWKE